MAASTVTVKQDLKLLLYVLSFTAFVAIANGSNCNTPKKIKDATYEYTGLRLPSGRYKEGAVTTYTCNEGFIKGKDSNGTYTCVKGKWKGDADNFRCCKLQICIDPNLFCILPEVANTSPDILDGNSSFPIEKGAGMAYGIGTVVKFNCNGDFFLRNGTATGPFECMRGGQWSPNNFTQCDPKECGPPPTIPNGRAERYYDWGSGHAVGTQYKYVCNDGYETLSILNTVRCTSDLTWETTLGFGSMPFSYGLPQCSTKYTPSGTNYGSSGSSSGSSWSSSSGSGSNTYDYKYNSNRRQWTRQSTTIFVLVVTFIIIFCVVVICARLRYDAAKHGRNRGMIVNGVMSTEYVGPYNYSGPAPTLTTGPVIFAPPSAPPPPPGSYPSQNGMYNTPETYPLTSHSPRSSSHFDAPPPTYNDVTSKPITTPY